MATARKAILYSSHHHAANKYRKELAEQTEQLEGLDVHKKQNSWIMEKCNEDTKKFRVVLLQKDEVNEEIEARKNELTQQESVVTKQREMFEQGLMSLFHVQQLQEVLQDYDQKVESKMPSMNILENQIFCLSNDTENLCQ